MRVRCHRPRRLLKKRREVEHPHGIDRAFPGAFPAQAGDLRALVAVERRLDAGASHHLGKLNWIVHRPQSLLSRRGGPGLRSVPMQIMQLRQEKTAVGAEQLIAVQ